MSTDEHDESWAAWQSTPWGRLRYRVMSENLTASLGDPGSPPLRVLDVGGADGADSVPLAASGHAVTVLDRSPSLLARARDRAAALGVNVVTVDGDLDDLPRLGLEPFDAVLCHNVLQYHPEPETAIGVISAQVGPSGLVSVMCPNPIGDVLDAAIRLEDPALARAMIGAGTKESITFATAMNRLESSDVHELLASNGFDAVTQYGVLAVTSYIANNDRKYEPDFYEALERLELMLRGVEPYVRTARFWHLVGRRS
jgi:S-adenosylmethionine-dependent methyltransferase